MNFPANPSVNIFVRTLAMLALCVFSNVTSIQGEAPKTHGGACACGKGHDPSTVVPLSVLQSTERSALKLAASKPAVVSRLGWGCPDGNDSPLWPPQYTAVTHLIVHHAASTNVSSNWANVVRDIFIDHRNGRNWGDIGYNYLIDPNGVIYEGRAGGDNVIGAHFSCFNGGTMGVCLLGNFETAQPSGAALTSLNRLLAWKCDQRGINPKGVTYHSNSRLTLNNISGHRDGNSSSQGCPSGTVCPGANLLVRLPQIRNEVAALIDGGDSTAPRVTSLWLAPTTVSNGNAFTIHYTVTDSGGSGLDKVGLWRTSDRGGAPDNGNWVEIDHKNGLSGNGPYSGSFSDAPPAGTYWYGIHVDDDAGNWNDERNSRSGGSPGTFGPDRGVVTGGGGGGAANLTIESTLIKDGSGGGSGNRDGKINAGEEIDLEVELRNTGSITARNVDGILSTSDPYIRITDDDRGWSDIGAAQTVNTSDFDFDVLPNAPAGHVISFNLRITSDQGTWNRLLQFEIEGGGSGGGEEPDLIVTGNGQIISDGDTDESLDDGTDFGTSFVGSHSPARTFVLQNTGNAPLLISNVDIGSNWFSASPVPNSIAPGSTANLTIRMDTSLNGSSSSRVLIESNAPGDGEYRFWIKGRTEKDDHAGSSGRATSIQNGNSAGGQLEFASDVDYFTFTVSETSIVEIRSAGSTDTLGSLFLANGSLLNNPANDNQAGGGTNFLIEETLAPGTYYVAVSGGMPQSTGAYGIEFNVLDTLPVPGRRPDLLLGLSAIRLNGDNLYADQGRYQRTKSITRRKRNLRYFLALENDSTSSDEIGVRIGRGNRYFRLTCREVSGIGKNVTAALIAGAYRHSIDARDRTGLAMKIRVSRRAFEKGKARTIPINVWSVNDPLRWDAAYARSIAKKR